MRFDDIEVGRNYKIRGVTGVRAKVLAVRKTRKHARIVDVDLYRLNDVGGKQTWHKTNLRTQRLKARDLEVPRRERNKDRD